MFSRSFGRTYRHCVLVICLLHSLVPVFTYVQNPCSDEQYSDLPLHVSDPSEVKQLLETLLQGIKETAELINDGMRQFNHSICNYFHLRILGSRPPIATLRAEILAGKSPEQALKNIYKTLEKVIVFSDHIKGQIRAVSYTRLREPILSSLTTMELGNHRSGVYNVMCTIAQHLPSAVMTDVDFRIVPEELYGKRRAQVIDDAYVIMKNMNQGLKDLVNELDLYLVHHYNSMPIF